jgi:hypothetical protein
MKVCDAGGDYHALGVLPGSIANAVTRINRVRAAASICAQIGSPGPVARAYRLRKCLAMRICTGQSSKVTTLAQASASNKEGHVSLLRLNARAQTPRHYSR